MKTNLTKSNGFTLIELLVVISIIAVLMGIMMPALNKAREVAKNAIDKSNNRNLSMGTMLWSEDNDGWALPGLWDRGFNGDSLIKPYLGDVESGTGVMLCPSVSSKYAGKTYDELGLTKDVAGLANGGNYYSSYGYNLILCNRTSKPLGIYDKANDDGTQWGKDNIWYKQRGNCRLSTVRKPSEKILFAESILYASYPGFYSKDMLNPAFKDQAARGRRHFVKRRPVIGTSEFEMCGKMNIAWIDGSVSEEPEGIEEPKSSGRGYQMVSSYWYGD
jgi:prepilin-type N-terminal cleavage/methylation domain-containing protein/prepilin-type processing-associated H-X9-DG protein